MCFWKLLCTKDGIFLDLVQLTESVVTLLARLLWTRSFILLVPIIPRPIYNKDTDFCPGINLWDI